MLCSACAYIGLHRDLTDIGYFDTFVPLIGVHDYAHSWPGNPYGLHGAIEQAITTLEFDIPRIHSQTTATQFITELLNNASKRVVICPLHDVVSGLPEIDFIYWITFPTPSSQTDEPEKAEPTIQVYPVPFNRHEVPNCPLSRPVTFELGINIMCNTYVAAFDGTFSEYLTWVKTLVTNGFSLPAPVRWPRR